MTSMLGLLLLTTSVLPAWAQSDCPPALTPTNSIRPTVASGYRAALVATGLSEPRGLQFDQAGNLLVVEQGSGSISALTLDDRGGTCVRVRTSKTVISNQELNHGIGMSANGSILYASTTEEVSSWDYNDSDLSVDNRRTLVSGMANSGHSTRTLLLSQNAPGMMVVSRGSASNVDLEASELASGHCQIKAFNLNNITNDPYDFTTDGMRLGWGLRNSVGLAEHPSTGGIYSVENSVDQMEREGKDIHEDNPGEELNFHGSLNGTSSFDRQGDNYGYPFCYAAWEVADIPNNSDLKVGSQFSIDPENGESRDDAFCADQVAPRLTFQAHTAPLDIKFGDSGNQAWVSFHGSWDRSDPAGYTLSVIEFKDGEPAAEATSKDAAVDILYNEDTSRCPDSCLRPVGIAVDGQGRLFVSSDSSGEIYVVMRDEESDGSFGSLPSADGGDSGENSSTAEDAAPHLVPISSVALLLLTSVMLLVA